MPPLPTLATPRLVLRPFHASDAAEVQRLAGDREVSATTLRLPHPYPDGLAEAWIATHAEDWRRGLAARFAITRDGVLLGAIGLELTPEHDRGELGYWLGRAFWGQGYATEAARAVVRFGFELLHLHRIQAHHFVRNPASGRVLLKAGLRSEGVRRGAFVKEGLAEDVVVYARLSDDPPFTDDHEATL
ncbi:MAG: GNAT family N-acetyltransferase [Gemmatimonadetes bacterium]|nr:GNAT family N-acetyltransferase [Gemmatimonadota bacterium]